MVIVKVAEPTEVVNWVLQADSMTNLLPVLQDGVAETNAY